MDEKTSMEFYGFAWNLIAKQMPEKARIEELKKEIIKRFPDWNNEKVEEFANDFNLAFEPEAYDMEAV